MPGEPVPAPSPPVVQDKAKYLLWKLEDTIRIVGWKRIQFQCLASAIKLAMIIFAGAGTILLGLQGGPAQEAHYKEAAFVLGAVVTMLAAIEPFFNYRALWVEHEQALARFYRLRDELAFHLSGEGEGRVDGKVLRKIHDQYQAVWEQLVSAWIGYRRAKGADQSEED